MRTTYLLPIRRPAGSGPLDAELLAYLRRLRTHCEVIVVDGSERDEFVAAHHDLDGVAQHVAPSADVECSNGKVRGVLSGMRLLRTPFVVIGDDDVRYDDLSLHRVESLLEDHDLVAPQNYFDPLPWHARWDTGRTLLNRSVGSDSPGTLALRRSVLERTGGYDGDVLFENLELIRTIEATGASCTHALDVYVRRLPPSPHKFFEQRVRQAYDEFARPRRLVLALVTVPAMLTLAARSRRALVLVMALVVLTAERGRRRAGGRAVFPWHTSLTAPAWVLERGVCSWIAVVHRLRGGCPYAGTRIHCAAHTRRALARRFGASSDQRNGRKNVRSSSTSASGFSSAGKCPPRSTVA